MKENTVAKAYAQALVQLASENQVDFVEEITNFNVLINDNNNFENLLFLDVFTKEEKKLVLGDVVEKMQLSPLLRNFLLFLVDEKRFSLFPLIFKEVIVLDDFKRGFLGGTIESSEESISDEVVTKLKHILEKKLGMKTELSFVQNKKISAGFRVTVGDLQLDASLERQLEQLKKSIFE